MSTQRKIELILTGVRVTWRHVVGTPTPDPQARFDADRLQSDVGILTDILRTYAGGKRNLVPGEGCDPPDSAVRLTQKEGAAIKKMLDHLADAVEEVAPYVRDDDV